jgi:uncharacterized surface protein with fasciclin (FAS1) repeats
MNRISKVLIVVVLMLVLVVPLVGAQEQSIVEIAVNDGRFDTLVAAVVAADLAEPLSGGEWTVFAPTDDAFAKLGLDASNVASTFSKEDLTDILLYHAIPASVSSAQAKTLLGDVTMANGQIAGLKYFDDSLWVNDDSRVIIQDIMAANGFIHVVDNVILPPWPRVSEDAEMEMSTETAMTEAAAVETAAETTATAVADGVEMMPGEESSAR